MRPRFIYFNLEGEIFVTDDKRINNSTLGGSKISPVQEHTHCPGSLFPSRWQELFKLLMSGFLCLLCGDNGGFLKEQD